MTKQRNKLREELDKPNEERDIKNIILLSNMLDQMNAELEESNHQVEAAFFEALTKQSEEVTEEGYLVDAEETEDIRDSVTIIKAEVAEAKKAVSDTIDIEQIEADCLKAQNKADGLKEQLSKQKEEKEQLKAECLKSQNIADSHHEELSKQKEEKQLEAECTTVRNQEDVLNQDFLKLREEKDALEQEFGVVKNEKNCVQEELLQQKAKLPEEKLQLEIRYSTVQEQKEKLVNEEDGNIKYEERENRCSEPEANLNSIQENYEQRVQELQVTNERKAQEEKLIAVVREKSKLQEDLKSERVEEEQWNVLQKEKKQLQNRWSNHEKSLQEIAEAREVEKLLYRDLEERFNSFLEEKSGTMVELAETPYLPHLVDCTWDPGGSPLALNSCNGRSYALYISILQELDKQRK